MITVHTLRVMSPPHVLDLYKSWDVLGSSGAARGPERGPGIVAEIPVGEPGSVAGDREVLPETGKCCSVVPGSAPAAGLTAVRDLVVCRSHCCLDSTLRGSYRYFMVICDYFMVIYGYFIVWISTVE